MKSLLLIAALGLAGCGEERRPLQSVHSNNNDYHVALLFEVDSCKIYRFEDNGRSRYFTTCRGSSVQWTDVYNHGKTRSYVDQSINTNN